MKRAVIKRLLKQEDYTLNRQFEDFAGFYGFKPLLCRSYRGQTNPTPAISHQLIEQLKKAHFEHGST